jgi:hypothetical protein
MDFSKYYHSQAQEEGLPAFKARPYMRGYGFGNVFKRFFRWISPIVKENALPILKNIGKEGLRTAANIANETLDGKDFSESAKANLKESIKKLSNQYGNGKKRRKKSSKQYGGGKKRKTKKKRQLDIFDKY